MQRLLDCFFPRPVQTPEPGISTTFPQHEALIASETLSAVCKCI
jgi:hypothetical protein